MTAPMAPMRRLLVSLFAASGLLLAACGGDGVDTELATIDDGSSVAVDSDRTSDGAELGEADAGEGPIDLNIMGDESDDGPIPEAVAPPAPSAAASPAERQRLQELGLVENTAPAMPAIPGVADSDRSDASNDDAVDAAPAQTPRADLDQFPSEIPAIVPGAPSGPTSPNAALFSTDTPSSGLGATSSDAGGFLIADAEVELGLSGGDNAVTVPDEIVSGDASNGDDVVVEGLALETAEQCEAGGPCLDLALMSGDGVGDAAGSDAAGGEVSVDADPDSVDDHCEARPYDRGCPLPVVDGGGPAFGDEGEDEEVQDARQDEGEGVDVPQDVIDALLAPVDNEGDGTDDAPNADGDAPQPDGTDGEVDADGSAD